MRVFQYILLGFLVVCAISVSFSKKLLTFPEVSFIITFALLKKPFRWTCSGVRQ